MKLTGQLFLLVCLHVCFILMCGYDLDSWSGSHIRWGQPFRLRHLTTGHYLALTEDRGLVLQDRERSDTIATAFCFRASKVRTITRTEIQGNKMYALTCPLFLKVTCVTWAQPHTSSLNVAWNELQRVNSKPLQMNRPRLSPFFQGQWKLKELLDQWRLHHGG